MTVNYLTPAKETLVTIDASDRPLPLRDIAAVKNALVETDPQVLLVAYAQLTGDDSLLEKFAPHIAPPYIGDSTIPPELLVELRTRMQAALTTAIPPTAAPMRLDRMQRLLSALVGEPASDEVVPMIIEQMGFSYVDEASGELPFRPAPADFKVIIIGAGLSAIATAVKLSKAGYDYEILEKAPEIGGVWAASRFPGNGVDTPSHIYAFSFDIKSDWPRYFSSGDDVRGYLHGIVDKFDIARHVTLNTTVSSCRHDDATGEWVVTSRTANGAEETRRCNVLINGSGLFTSPQIPNFPGLDSFKGRVVHTARWDNSFDFAGKRVGMIGTGASALQVGPSIAPQASQFTVFQRTAPWLYISPKQAKSVPGGAIWAMKHIPFVKEWFRVLVYWSAGDAGFECVKVDPAWPNQERSVSMASEGFRMWLEAGIHQALADRPELIEKVMPNFPPFGKRVCQEFGWYAMLKQPNVALETDGIERITETGILTSAGQEIPLDIIIMATGYGMFEGFSKLDVVGRNGTRLEDVWEPGNPRAHLGMTIPGFPNYFFLIGPNSVPTHGGGVNFTSEAQANYILRCIELMQTSNAKSIEITRDAYDGYNRDIDAALDQRVWNHPAVSSYYLNAQRRNIACCPWRVVDYWHMTRGPQPGEYAVR